MGQDPSQIRQDVEQTREQMGNTVEALGHKTDVTGRAKEAVSDKVDTLRSKVSGATPDSKDVTQGARRATGVAQENPLGLGIAALGAGFLAGLLIPGTKVEDEKIGPVADQVKETGQEALERGKHVAEQAAETAKDTGREQAEQLKNSAQATAQEASTA
jgi:gas vesicle protein